MGEVVVDDRGIIRRLDLNTLPMTTDLTGDGLTNLADYSRWRASLVGPAVIPTDPCDQADLNRDGRIDLKDFASLQNAIRD